MVLEVLVGVEFEDVAPEALGVDELDDVVLGVLDGGFARAAADREPRTATSITAVRIFDII